MNTLEVWLIGVMILLIEYLDVPQQRQHETAADYPASSVFDDDLTGWLLVLAVDHDPGDIDAMLAVLSPLYRSLGDPETRIATLVIKLKNWLLSQKASIDEGKIALEEMPEEEVDDLVWHFFRSIGYGEKLPR